MTHVIYILLSMIYLLLVGLLLFYSLDIFVCSIRLSMVILFVYLFIDVFIYLLIFMSMYMYLFLLAIDIW